MIWLLLIVQVPHASHVGRVTFFSRPLDSFLLGPKDAERVISMILYNVVRNWTAFGPPLRAGFNKNCSHFSPAVLGRPQGMSSLQ